MLLFIICGSIVDIQSATAKNRRRKKKTERQKKKRKKEEETTGQKYNGLPLHMAAIEMEEE